MSSIEILRESSKLKFGNDRAREEKKEHGDLPQARHRSALRLQLNPSYPVLGERCIVHGNDMVPVIRSRPCICHQQFRPSPTKVDQY